MAKRATLIRTNQIADNAITETEIATSVAGAGLGGGGGAALSVNVDDTSIEISTDTLQIKDDGITAAKLNSDTAGLGLVQAVGGELDVNVDDSTIEINADTVRVKTDGIGANELDLTETYDYATAGGTVQVSTPTADTDAANKAYVDGLANGVDWKASVRLATASALPANTAAGSGVGKTLTADANGALTVDGVAVAVSDRILVKDEATAADNGIYTVTATGDGANPYVLTRATDADENDEVTANLAVFVEEGTANVDSGWVLTTNDPITVDTTGQSYTQFTGLGQVTAGAGLTKTGNVLDVGDANKGVQVNADDLEIDASEMAGNGLSENGTNSWELDLDLNSLTAAVVDVAADSIAIVDADDTNITRKESIADLITAIAGAGLGDSLGVLSVNVDDSTIEISTDTLQVKDLGITNAKIANDTIQEPKLNATNAPSDGQVLSYNAAGTNFTWIDAASASGTVAEADIQVEEFAGDDSTTAFVLSNTPVANSMIVFINSAYGRRGAGKDYTLSGSTVTVLGDVLATGETLTVHYVIDN